jgi:hypothetical protein
MFTHSHFYFGMLSLLYIPICNSNPPETMVKVNVDHHQTLNIETQDPILCEPLGEEALAQCFYTLDHKNKIRTFIGIDLEKRRELLRNIKIREFAKFIDRCSEEEWHFIHEHLTDIEQKHVHKDINYLRYLLGAMFKLAAVEDVGGKALLFFINPLAGFIYICADSLSYLTGKGCLIYNHDKEMFLQDYFKKTFFKD